MTTSQLTIPQLLDTLATRRVELWVDNGALKFRAPNGAFTPELKQQVVTHKAAIIEALQRGIVVRDPDNAHQPFPLTEVQASYLVGRTHAFQYGGVGCHGYTEFDILNPAATPFTPEQLTAAWDAVVAAHPMMRCEVHPDGWQRVNPDLQVPLQVHDLRQESADQVASVRADIAHRYRNKVYDITAGEPLVDALVTLGPDDTVLHVSVDLLLTDFLGLSVIFADFEQALLDPANPPAAPSLTFRDYLASANLQQESPAGQRKREQDTAWWEARLDDLPGAFALSEEARPDVLAASTVTVDGVDIPHYSRHSTSLSPAEWSEFTARAQQHGLTPSAVLMAALGRVLRRYTGMDAGLVTLTVLARQPFTDDVNRVVGDFTSTALLPLSNSAERSFAANAQQVQTDLFESLDHTAIAGTEVSRLIGRHTGQDNFFTPIVITSTVGAADDTVSDVLIPRAGSGISQTPQVLMDVQLSPQGAGISIDWDTRDGAFSASVLDAAYEDYIGLVRQLISDDPQVARTAWEGDSLPRRTVPAITREPSSQPTDGVLGTLHGPILNQALRTPDATAVVDPTVGLGTYGLDHDVTYRALLNRALQFRDALGDTTLQPGEPAALCFPAGRDQVAAQLAVLMMGGAYVPLDPEWPEGRRTGIVQQLAAQRSSAAEQAGAAEQASTGYAPNSQPLLLDTAWAATVPAASEAADQELPLGLLDDAAADPTQVAYIIFTSGSTGTPKGVVITHEQARTTIDCINDSLTVGSEDAVLAVSRYSFDLAVYNIFGLLGRGGRVVFPQAGTLADPHSWLRDITNHNVTIWDSVPAQLELVLDALPDFWEDTNTDVAQQQLPLRAALLSGDWIPTNQPARIQAAAPGVRFFAMGGATEGSIWSNLHEVMPGEEIESSVPYGRGLRNQGMWILNADLEDCVPGQIGDITIGGDGVAAGYFGDPSRTVAAFFTEPDHGERAYRTGDRGRYLPNGEIEFLGRIDGQVKIRGHRIELGEIDAVLRSHPGVDDAFALVHQDAHSGAHQVAAVVTAARNPELVADRTATYDAQVNAATVTADRYRADVHEDALQQLSDTLELVSLRALADELERALTGTTDAADDAATSTDTAGDAAAALTLEQAEADHRLGRWCRELRKRGWTIEQNAADSATDGTRTTVTAPADIDITTPVETLWQQIYELDQQVGYGTTMLQFIQDCTTQIHGLRTGAVDAKQLFFPEGRMEVARAAYGDNLASRYLNDVLVSAIRARVQQMKAAAAESDTPASSQQTPLRILEVGAGVGATTQPLVEMLVKEDAFDPETPLVSYTFTDITTFFLDSAKEEWPQLHYQLFDITHPGAHQGIADGSIDLIIAANVLHNCTDMPTVLENLHALLAPGGQLAIIESTIPSPVLMASVEFQEGLNGGFTDARADTNAAFMTIDQWHSTLQVSPFHNVKQWPAEGDIMEAGNSHVLLCQRTDTIEEERLLPAPLLATSRKLLPAYMVPSTVIITDSIPLTDNGKVDRKALAALCDVYVQGQHAGEAGALADLTPTEDAIAAVWRDVLNLEDSTSLSPTSDFFALGGDSLLLARCVGRMRSEVPGGDAISWDDLLREVVAAPTIGAVAGVITQANAGDVTSTSTSTSPSSAAADDTHTSAAAATPAGDDFGTGANITDSEGYIRPEYLPKPKGDCWQEVMPGTGRYANVPASEEALLFVHDGTGNLTHYETLFEHLGKQPNRPAIIGISRQADDSYLDINPRILFPLLAQRYTKNLLETLHPQKLHVMSYCMGGLICANMVTDLAVAGVEVVDYTAISAYRIPFIITDDLLLDFALARVMHVEPADMGLRFDEASLGGVLREVREKYGRIIPDGAIYEAAPANVRADWDAAPATHEERLETLSAKHPQLGGTAVIEQISRVFRQSLTAVGMWEGVPYFGDVHFLRNKGDIEFLPTLGDDMESFWEGYALGDLRIDRINGTHFTCMEGDNAPEVAEILRQKYDPQPGYGDGPQNAGTPSDTAAQEEN